MSNTEEGNIFSAISDVNMALFEKKQPLNFGCGICYEDLIGNTTKKECGHVFHDKCILKKLADDEPLCYHGKESFTSKEECIFYVFLLFFFGWPFMLCILAECIGYKFENNGTSTSPLNMSSMFSAANIYRDNYFNENITF